MTVAGLSASRAPRLGGSSSSSRSSSRSSSGGPSVAPPRLARSSFRRAAAADDDSAVAATTTTTKAAPAQRRYTGATLRTTDACELAVSIYPFFRYKASGGGGDATVVAVADSGDDADSGADAPHLLRLSFDPASLRIPALDSRTALLFGLVPIPPYLSIAIRPLALAGTLDARTGEAALTFDAEFLFTAGPLYRAPALRVRTVLTTGASSGMRLSGTGRRWGGAQGGSSPSSSSSSSPSPSPRSIRLAGVALVPKTGDAFLDAFLMLPNDALAVLEGEIELE